MASNSETPVKIRGRAINVSVDGLSELEIITIAGQVEEKIRQIEEKTKIADTSKLAIIAAFEFNTALYNLRQKSEVNGSADEKKIDELVARLEKTMEKGLSRG